MNRSRNHDEQFEQFLRESISSEESSLDTARVMKYLDPQKKASHTNWMDGLEEEDFEDEEDEDDIGLTGGGSKFLKKKPSAIASKNGPKFGTGDKVEKSVSFSQEVGMSRDSLDDESLGLRLNGVQQKQGCPVPALSLDSTHSMTATDTMTSTKPKSFEAGRETLEEIADKEKFFQKLERASDDTIDYSRLNKELDVSATIGSNTLVANEPKGYHNGQGTTTPSGVYQNGIHSDGEDMDETANNSPQITAIRNKKHNQAPLTADTDLRQHQGSPDNRQSMLSRVALMDSLDSPLNTRVGTSHDTRDSDDIHTIPEGTHEEEQTIDDKKKTRKETRFEETVRVDDDRAGDSTYGKGLTLKTTGTTALGYTDTSREIEAYHQALQQVGMDTLDDTRDMTLIQSSAPGTLNTSDRDHTGAFGLKPVAPPRSAATSGRTVDDIMREVEEINLYTVDETNAESRGFDLSPAHTRSYGKGYDVVDSMENYDQGYDMSPTEKTKHTVKFLPVELPDARIAPSTPPRSRSRSTSRGRKPLSPDKGPVPARRKDKREPKNKYSNVRSSGYGNRSPSPKRSQHSTQAKVWSPAEIQKRKVKGTDSISKVKNDLKMNDTDPMGKSRSIADHHLMDSVNSFTSYIQDHFGSVPGLTRPEKPARTQSHWLPEHTDPSLKLKAIERERETVHDAQSWQDQLQEERKLLAKSRAENAALERKLKNTVDQMRIDHEQELFKIKQENYVLTAKVAEVDATQKRRKGSLLTDDSTEGPGKERVELLEREVQEQERLLASYQQENERLYQEMKKMQQQNKGAEEKMFRENQRLANEVANIREQLVQKELALKNKGIITSPSVQQQIAAGNMGPAVLGAGRIAQLEAELKQSKVKGESMKMDIDTLVTAKQELAAHVEELVKQIQECEAKLNGSNGLQSERTQKKIIKLEEEIERLNNKLKWYAENQELLDKDAKLLRKKDEAIHKLKQKIDTLQNESGKRTSDLKAKERSLDARKIQDLERQVREMENIIRKRHPNSLPVLMWAASNSPDPSQGTKAPSVAFLEKHVDKLQQELDAKDDDAKKSFRVLEQKYNTMKFQYEERIQSLEDQLLGPQCPDLAKGHPHTHAAALQKELDSVKERHKKKISELEAETVSIKKELATSKARENALKSCESRQLKEADSESQLRVKVLSLEVSNQEKLKQTLLKTIETLKQEKQQLVIESTRTAGLNAKAQGNKLQTRLLSRPGKVTSSKPSSRKSSPREEEPAKSEVQPLVAIKDAWTDKEYQPMVFAGQHVSDILRENDDLKQKLEILQLDFDQQRVMTQKLVAEGEAQGRKARENTDDKVSAMRIAHQAEVQRLLADHAIHTSTSRVAELQGKLDTQEVVLRHLKEQLALTSVDQEKLSTLRIRETTLEAQLRQAMDDLREAKFTHTPEMKHFASLQDKIRQMEERHALREKELQSVIKNSHTVAHTDVSEEISQWRQLVDSKNRELERFRVELDSILEVLRVLQRQGVVLPVGGSSSQLSSQR